MVIITTVAYPPESAKELAERFLTVPAIPDYMTRKGPYIGSNLDDGVLTYSIWELDKSKMADGYEFLANYLAGFFGVPGFTYKIRVCFDLEEALPMIGMG